MTTTSPPLGEQDGLCLSRAAARDPERCGLVIDGESLSYESLWERVQKRLPTLAECGPTVAIVARPTLDALVTLYAALELHLDLFLVHPAWDRETRCALTQKVGVDATFDDQAPNPFHQDRAATRPGEGTVYLATSGSSGSPKIAVLSRTALIAACRGSANNLGWTPGDRWLLSLPFAHVGGLSVVLRCLLAGKTMVVDPLRPQDPGYCRMLSRQGVTVLSLVPTQLAALRDRDPPSSVRAVLVGGAPAPAPLVQALRARAWPLLLTYGMTEMGSQIATQAPGASGIDDVGAPLSHVDLRLSPNGEILVRGASLFSGYLGEPSAIDSQGFFSTKDRGELAEDGALRVVGRVDHTLISGGENVDPQWVEARLAALLQTDQLALTGVPDPRWGTRLVLVLSSSALASLGENAEVAHARLRARIGGHLPAYCLPKNVLGLDALPLTPSGKLDRERLAKTARSLMSGVDATDCTP